MAASLLVLAALWRGLRCVCAALRLCLPLLCQRCCTQRSLTGLCQVGKGGQGRGRGRRWCHGSRGRGTGTGSAGAGRSAGASASTSASACPCTTCAGACTPRHPSTPLRLPPCGRRRLQRSSSAHSMVLTALGLAARACALLSGKAGVPGGEAAAARCANVHSSIGRGAGVKPVRAALWGRSKGRQEQGGSSSRSCCCCCFCCCCCCPHLQRGREARCNLCAHELQVVQLSIHGNQARIQGSGIGHNGLAHVVMCLCPEDGVCQVTQVCCNGDVVPNNGLCAGTGTGTGTGACLPVIGHKEGKVPHAVCLGGGGHLENQAPQGHHGGVAHGSAVPIHIDLVLVARLKKSWGGDTRREQ